LRRAAGRRSAFVTRQAGVRPAPTLNIQQGQLQAKVDRVVEARCSCPPPVGVTDGWHFPDQPGHGHRHRIQPEARGRPFPGLRRMISASTLPSQGRQAAAISKIIQLIIRVGAIGNPGQASHILFAPSTETSRARTSWGRSPVLARRVSMGQAVLSGATRTASASIATAHHLTGDATPLRQANTPTAADLPASPRLAPTRCLAPKLKCVVLKTADFCDTPSQYAEGFQTAAKNRHQHRAAPFAASP